MVVDVVLVVFSVGSIDSVTLSDSNDPHEMKTDKRKIIGIFVITKALYQINF